MLLQGKVVVIYGGGGAIGGGSPASDRAGALTATVLNVTGGAIVD